MNQKHKFYDNTENGWTCIIRMVFVSNNTFTNKLISNLYACIVVTELDTVTPHFVAISVLISKVDFSLDVVA